MIEKNIKNPTAYLQVAIQAFLVLATLIVYLQTGGYDFVNYDDDRYVMENPYIRSGLTRDNILWAFTDAYQGNWHPLTWISHMLDINLFGMAPGKFHLTNVVLHVCNVLLVFGAFRRLTGEVWKSAVVAALFAVHPLHVESVAWISQRKDVLSAFFGLLSLWAYVAYVRNPGIIRYAIVFVFLVLGLMSKFTLVTLPFVLLLLDYWPLRRLSPVGRRVLEKMPLFLLAGFSCWIAYTAQKYGGAVRSMEDFPLRARIGNAFVSYAAYIGKTIWPRDLIFFYPHQGESQPLWQIAMAALVVSAVTIAVFRNVNEYPFLAVGWFWYLGTLVPVIGLVQIGRQAMADRYTYLPSLGLFIIFVWGIAGWTERWRQRRRVLPAVSVVMLLVLAFLAWKQAGYWKDSFALYEHALSVVPDNIPAKNNYAEAQTAAANVLLKQGKFNEADERLQKAFLVNPGFSKIYNGFGNLFSRQGKIAEAVAQYRKAVEMEPGNDMYRNNLGVALLQSGAVEQAVEQFGSILSRQPDNVDAHNNMGLAMMRQGLFKEAVLHYEAAIKSLPNEAGLHYNKALALSAIGERESAVISLETALSLRPDFGLAETLLKSLRPSPEHS